MKLLTNKFKNMPRFDKTGPLGSGPKTGWGMGPCGAGMGQGRGYGRGCGWRRFYTQKEETEMLNQETEDLKQELKAIEERLSDLKDQEK